MKYGIGGLWLILALALQKPSSAHTFFSYAGSIIAFVHAGALGCGLLYQRSFDRRSVEGGVSMVGFLIGVVVGVVLGIWAGGAVSRNSAAYWLAQIAAAAFIVFLPLFRL
jgi:hypothetical protein